MSAEHTPGELERNEIKGWELWIGANYHIADVHGQLYARRANALHLCRCWNSHDALLEACKELLGDWWCARSSCQNPECRACQNAKADKLRYETIIAQAEKEG